MLGRVLSLLRRAGVEIGLGSKLSFLGSDSNPHVTLELRAGEEGGYELVIVNPTGVAGLGGLELNRTVSLSVASIGILNNDGEVITYPFAGYENGAGGTVAFSLENATWTQGAGSPEGVVIADKGSLYSNRTDGTIWRKAVGDAPTNTGWVELADA